MSGDGEHKAEGDDVTGGPTGSRAVKDRSVTVPIVRFGEGGGASVQDRVAVEEPLEIRIAARPLGITMRTPGNDEELAAGLLLSEGIIGSIDDIGSIVVCRDESTSELDNVVNVRLVEGVAVDWDRVKRSLLTTSSCGVCGKASIEALRARTEPLALSGSRFEAAAITRLPEELRAGQIVFEATGGLHAAGLFSRSGELRLLREDVGRHNAVDKVVGAAMVQRMFPLDDAILMVSGRASFEIVQKAAVARIPMVAAVSAPSSLAVDLARDMGITLVGFLRGSGFNVYTHGARLAPPLASTSPAAS